MRPVVLCILDGWGLSPSREANAVALARTPNFDRIWATCPHAQLAAHGPDVGLPEGQMGNSEVGHTNIGAGRVVSMDLPRIDNAVADGSFAKGASRPRPQQHIPACGAGSHWSVRQLFATWASVGVPATVRGSLRRVRRDPCVNFFADPDAQWLNPKVGQVPCNCQGSRDDDCQHPLAGALDRVSLHLWWRAGRPYAPVRPTGASFDEHAKRREPRCSHNLGSDPW